MLGLGLLSVWASVPATPSLDVESLDCRLSSSVRKLMHAKCPMRQQACRLWRIQPSGLVRASLGFSLPGIYDMLMEPSDFQSLIAKYGIAMCQERLVGVTDLTIFLVD